MRRGRHAADDGSFGRSAGGAMARGVLLIVAAVVLGLVLLDATDRGGTQSISAGSGDGATPAAVAGATDTTEATLPIAHDPADVTVLVANGSGVKGAGAAVAERLKVSNFVTIKPVNTTNPANSSAVYFAPGFEADARGVAALLEPSPPVSALPSPLPVADLAGAHVLVVLAADLAAPTKSTPGTTPTTAATTSTSIRTAPTA